MSAVLPRVPAVSIDEIIANSFRDYHVKGFDYICLRRSPKETVKLYFFDGDVSKMPEVVNPHDHRYDFKTMCVAGRVQNIWFREDPEGEMFNRFAYDTPLLGGSGFSWVGETKLKVAHTMTRHAGGVYFMEFDEVHTIRLVENETVICLVQMEDRVVDRPTLTFARPPAPPSLDVDRLYNRFTADQVIARLDNLRTRVPTIRLPVIA